MRMLINLKDIYLFFIKKFYIEYLNDFYFLLIEKVSLE